MVKQQISGLRPLMLPDKCWVELKVDKYDHLHGHDDSQATDAAHHHLGPVQT